jgi:hypothetical protein
MHRGRKAMPVQIKACNQRCIQRCQARHRQKVSARSNNQLYHGYFYESASFSDYVFQQLRDMKCSIDNKPPRQATHLKTKVKKNALMEDPH